jgi:hypothetical protein
MTRRPVTRALLGVVLGAVAALATFALWWRRNPSACPYGLRFFVELPHPFITRYLGRSRPRHAGTPSESEAAAGAARVLAAHPRWVGKARGPSALSTNFLLFSEARTAPVLAAKDVRGT